MPECIADDLSYLKAQRDANECRLEMTPSEKVAMGRAIEERLRPEAKERQREGARLTHRIRDGSVQAPGDSPEASIAKPSTRDQAAEAVGMSGQTYDRAKKVVEAAEDESLPEEARKVAQEAQEEMDATGKVNPAFKKVQEEAALVKRLGWALRIERMSDEELTERARRFLARKDREAGNE